MKFYYWILLGLLTTSLCGQLPITHIYSFEWSRDSSMVTNPQLLSGFNLNGYNNQPSFIDQDKIFLTLAWHIDDQTDIYTYDLIKKELTPITKTSDSEYSPTQSRMGGWECIRVDGNKKQWYWTYPQDGSHRGQPVWNGSSKVGYFKNIELDSAVVFITGKPNQMALINVEKNNKYCFTSKIGRSFYPYNGYIYYLHKLTEQSWYIKKYSPFLRRSTIIVKAMPGIEDFYLDGGGQLFCAKGATIFKFNKSLTNPWLPFLDLSDWGLHQITRIIINEKYIICVDKVE